jgi:hypothetical protein
MELEPESVGHGAVIGLDDYVDDTQPLPPPTWITRLLEKNTHRVVEKAEE